MITVLNVNVIEITRLIKRAFLIQPLNFRWWYEFYIEVCISKITISLSKSIEEYPAKETFKIRFGKSISPFHHLPKRLTFRNISPVTFFRRRNITNISKI